MSKQHKKQSCIAKIFSFILVFASVITLIIPRQTTIVHADEDTDSDVRKQRVVIAPLCDNFSDEIDIQVVDEEGNWTISNKWHSTDRSSGAAGHPILHFTNIFGQAAEDATAFASHPLQTLRSVWKSVFPRAGSQVIKGNTGTGNVTNGAFNRYAIYRAPNWSNFSDEHEYLNFPGQSYQLGNKNERGITGIDEALANNVASKMTNSFDQMIDLVESESADDVKIQTFVVFLAKYMEEDPGSKGKVKDNPQGIVVDGNTDVIMSWTAVNSGDPGANKLKQTRGVDKGTYAKNFMNVTVTNINTQQSNTQLVQFAVPKGYSPGQYAPDSWNSEDKLAHPVPYISISGIATYAGYMALRGYYTGETTADFIYPDQNWLSKAVGELFQAILRGLYAAVGVQDVTKLVFNRGVVIGSGSSAVGYYEGIMPYKSMETVRMFYWIFLVIAVFVLFEAVYITVIKRSMADISPAMRADFKDDLMRLIIVLILEMIFQPVFGILCRMNTFIVSMCSALVADWANLFRLSVYNFGFIFVSFVTFALTITINIQYMVRQLAIGVCFMIAPVAIATLAYDSKRNIFNVWLKALIANIFMQSFNAIVLAMLYGVANNIHSSLMRIALIYAIIPLTKWFKEDLCGLKDGAMDMANGISSNFKRDRDTAKRNAGNAVAQLADNHAAIDMAQANNLKLPLGGLGKTAGGASGGSSGGGGSGGTSGAGGSDGSNSGSKTKDDSSNNNAGQSNRLRDKVHDKVSGFIKDHPTAAIAAFDAVTVGAELAGIHTGHTADRAIGKWIGRGGLSEKDYAQQQLNAEGEQRLRSLGYDDLQHGWTYTDKDGQHFTDNEDDLAGKDNINEVYRARIRDNMVDDQTWQKMKDQNVTNYEPGNQQLIDGLDGQKYVQVDADSSGLMDIGKTAQRMDEHSDGFDHNIAPRQVYASTGNNGSGFSGNKINRFKPSAFNLPAIPFYSVSAQSREAAYQEIENARAKAPGGTTYNPAVLDTNSNTLISARDPNYNSYVDQALDPANPNYQFGYTEQSSGTYDDAQQQIIQAQDDNPDSTITPAVLNTKTNDVIGAGAPEYEKYLAMAQDPNNPDYQFGYTGYNFQPVEGDSESVAYQKAEEASQQAPQGTTYSPAILHKTASGTNEIIGAGTNTYQEHLAQALDADNSDYQLGYVEGTEVNYASTESNIGAIRQNDNIERATVRTASQNFNSKASQAAINIGSNGTAHIFKDNTIVAEDSNTNINLYATRAAGTKSVYAKTTSQTMKSPAKKR